MWFTSYALGETLKLLLIFQYLNIIFCGEKDLGVPGNKIQTADTADLNLITVGNKAWNCNILDACDDKLGLEAILLLHQRLDDDANGNIDIAESDDFLRDELKYANSAERQKSFHRNDKHITADELWHVWKISEVHNWTTDETVNWLITNVELPQYATNFMDRNIDGTALPRMAVNNMHFLSNLGIKDPIHKQKISLKATDIVLFGPPKNHNYLKDAALISSLIIGAAGCWFAYAQNKKAQKQLKKTMIDMESLQRAEDALQDLQKQLDEAKLEQEKVATQKKNLEQMLQNEGKNEVGQQDITTEEKLKALETELAAVYERLRHVKKALDEKVWIPPPGLQPWLQLSYEIEVQHYNAKKAAAEQQLASAKEGCEKLRKKRSGLLGTFRVAHGNSIDDVDNRISQAKSALSEVTNDLSERLDRWRKIEGLCGFNIVRNPGIRQLEALLRNVGTNITSHIPQTPGERLSDDDSITSNTFPPGVSARSLSNIPHSISQRSILSAAEASVQHSLKQTPLPDLKACASSGAILQRTDAVYEYSDSYSTDCDSFEEKSIEWRESGISTSDTSRPVFTIGESIKDNSGKGSALKRRPIELAKVNKSST